ncbi:hypothetical protein Droror1_Dr00019011 [Drosera rotundifolia]
MIYFDDNPQVFFLKLIILLLFLSFLSSIVADFIPDDDILVSLFKFIFFTLNSVSNLIFRIIFTTIAHVVVLTIHGLKVSGETTMGILQEVSGFMKSILEYVVGLIFEAMNEILLTTFNLVKDGIVEALSVTSSIVGGLIEMAKGSLEGLLSDVPEVANGFKDMVSTFVSDLWNNYKEAMGYIKDNA